MEFRSQLFPVLTFVAFLIAVGINWYIDGQYEKEQNGIVIGILSARENFEQRNALRKTWIRFLKEEKRIVNKSVSHKFIIGTDGCEIPLEGRINKFSCEWDPYIATYADQDIMAYKMDKREKLHVGKEPIGLDFTVIHPIVIKKLGILAFAEKDYFSTSIKVTIYDRITMICMSLFHFPGECIYKAKFSIEHGWVYKTEVVSAHFNRSLVNENGFWLQSVDNYMLPSEFKGSLVVDGNGEDYLYAKSNLPCGINDGGGVLKFKRITRHGPINGYFPVNIVERNSFCYQLPATFTYKPYETKDDPQEDTAQKIAVRLEMLDNWTRKLRNETEHLKKESKKYGDILFVNVKDYYRNIPKKLLKFYKWASIQNGLQFTIKTDDDCYLNIPRIIQEIDHWHLDSKDTFWFGSFRLNWPVEAFGKWAENDFPSSVYPAFACGSGNMLPKSVIDWINLNSDYFHLYQGEDVSMGIWLSAILPRILNDERWSCFKICRRDMLSLPNNNGDELKSLYNNHMKCNDPCGCRGP